MTAVDLTAIAADATKALETGRPLLLSPKAALALVARIETAEINADEARGLIAEAKARWTDLNQRIGHLGNNLDVTRFQARQAEVRLAKVQELLDQPCTEDFVCGRWPGRECVCWKADLREALGGESR